MCVRQRTVLCCSLAFVSLLTTLPRALSVSRESSSGLQLSKESPAVQCREIAAQGHEGTAESTCVWEELKAGTEDAVLCVPEVLVIRSAVDKPE